MFNYVLMRYNLCNGCDFMEKDNFTDDVEIFGVEIVRAYDMNVKDAYELISKNTNYLKDISINEVKDIKFSYYKDIIILLNNGRVLVNGKEVFINIKLLAFMSGVTIFGISNDNEIICIVGTDCNTRFMCSNNYKYKKIIITPLVMVTLNYDKEIKVYGTLVDNIVDYRNYFDVDDIGYFESGGEIVVFKDDRVISLFFSDEYNDDIEVTLFGEGRDFVIVE